MSNLQWYHLVGSLVGGGAMGALLTAVISAYRNRVQPVSWRQEVIPVFRKPRTGSALNGKLIVQDDQAESQFDNLFIVETELVNRGNRDFEEFPLCVELAPYDRVISVRPETNDLSHQAHLVEETKPSNPSSVLNLTLKPFNRGDSCVLKMYVVTDREASEPGDISLSSSAPVRLTRASRMADTLLGMANMLSIDFFGFRLLIGSQRQHR